MGTRTVLSAIVSIYSSGRRVFRVGDWMRYKIAELFLPAYFLLLVGELPLSESLGYLVGLLVYFLPTASLGYFLNDLSDIESDRRAGKRNVNGRLSPTLRATIILGLVATSVLGLYLLGPTAPLVALAVAEIVCFVVYSFPPLRMKERLAGPIVDALYAHVIPFLIAVTAAPGAIPRRSLVVIGVLALVWQSIQGVRNILGHQVSDIGADTRSGTWTAARRIGPSAARLLHAGVIPLLELGAFGLLLGAVWRFTPVPTFVFAAFAAVMLLVYGLAWRRGYAPGSDLYAWDRVLNEAYRSWMPATMLVLLTIAHSAFLPVLVLHVLLFGPPRIASPPSPPSWEVDIALDGLGQVRCAGWWLVTEFDLAEIEVVVDGRWYARAEERRPDADLLERIASRPVAVAAFDATVPLPGAKAAHDLDVAVIATRPDRTAFVMERTTLRTGPAETERTRPDIVGHETLTEERRAS